MKQYLNNLSVLKNTEYDLCRSYLDLAENHQTFKSLAGQRTIFFKFLKYMYNLTDQQVINLNNDIKCINFSKMECKDISLDLIQDLTHYHLCLRNINSHFSVQILSEIVQSWFFNCKLARNFEVVTSELLIDSAQHLKDAYNDYLI